MSFYRHIIIATAAVCISTSVMAATAAQTAPAQTPSAVQTDVAKTGAAQQGKININTASLQELMSVKGMNQLKAKSIVRYRNQHLFKSLDVKLPLSTIHKNEIGQYPAFLPRARKASVEDFPHHFIIIPHLRGCR